MPLPAAKDANTGESYDIYLQDGNTYDSQGNPVSVIRTPDTVITPNTYNQQLASKSYETKEKGLETVYPEFDLITGAGLAKDVGLFGLSKLGNKWAKNKLLDSSVKNITKNLGNSTEGFQEIPLEDGFVYRTFTPSHGGFVKNNRVYNRNYGIGDVKVQNGKYYSVRQAHFNNPDKLWWDKFGHNRGQVVQVTKESNTQSLQDAANNGFSLNWGFFGKGYKLSDPIETDKVITYRKDPISGTMIPSMPGKIVTNKQLPSEIFQATEDNPIMQLSYYKPTRKAWSTGKAEGNEATSYFFKQQPNQRFELVKDVGPNNYSVHFKTDRNGLNYGNKMQLFAKVADEVPEGANLSTWGSVSKGGIHGINRFGKDFGFIRNGTRQLTMKGTKEPVEVGVFQKPLNHHLQGDDAVKMFKEYGGTPIPEGSLNGDQLRKYVMEARERYGLMDNPNISDEEIAQALYKHTNELGKGSAAINSQGEPQLLFRGDTKPYTKLKVNHNQIGKSDTEDNVLGTMFLDRTGIGEGWGPDRYMYLANQDNEVMAPYRDGIETASFTTLQPKFKPDYITPVEGKGFVGNFDISYPYYKYDRRYGVISGGKISSEAFADGYTNQLNGFVVRTPHERDITNEVYTNGMYRTPKAGEEFQWRVPHTTDISSAPRETRILQNKAIIKDAQQKNQGLLRSKAGSPYRDEHDKYDYLVVPDFNVRNVKHILPYDLRIPRNWSDPNIFRIAAPIGMSLPFLNNSQK